jgi:hypothetical protein
MSALPALKAVSAFAFPCYARGAKFFKASLFPVMPETNEFLIIHSERILDLNSFSTFELVLLKIQINSF